jgi:hypothetical protein
MGLNEVIDVTETQQPGPQGELQQIFQVTFTTERASGSFSIDIPASDFSPESARQRAAERAEEIDATFTSDDGE